jgi:hypothetical protein
MKVLVACEFSGRVSSLLRDIGCDAYSCDLLPTESTVYRKFHIQDDVLSIINHGWDMMLAFPPCTHLSISGARYFERKRVRQEEALQFVKELWNAPIPFICIENPVSVISTRMRKPHQIIQPYQFGDDASKATYLWLKGLPKLKIPPEDTWIAPRIVDGKKRWASQLDSGQSRHTNITSRAMKRSRTYPGIAHAMATQWGMLKFSGDSEAQPWFTRHSDSSACRTQEI